MIKSHLVLVLIKSLLHLLFVNVVVVMTSKFLSENVIFPNIFQAQSLLLTENIN